MARNECSGCGNVLNTNEKECKYCGTANDGYVKPAVSVEVGHKENVDVLLKTKDGGSIFVFIVLLIFCWPIAILYAVSNFKK